MANLRRASALGLVFSLLLAVGFTGGCGSSDSGPSAPAIDTVPPAIPGGVDGFTEFGPELTIHLSWNANVTDADLAGYVIYRSHSADSGFVSVGPALVSANSWVDEDVELGRSYYYRVAARDASANESGLSTVFTQVTPNEMPDLDGPTRIYHPGD